MQLRIMINRESAATRSAPVWGEVDPNVIAGMVHDVAEDIAAGIPEGDVSDGNGNKLGSYLVTD